MSKPGSSDKVQGLLPPPRFVMQMPFFLHSSPSFLPTGIPLLIVLLWASLTAGLVGSGGGGGGGTEDLMADGDMV